MFSFFLFVFLNEKRKTTNKNSKKFSASVIPVKSWYQACNWHKITQFLLSEAILIYTTVDLEHPFEN